jgi:uncharacterized membrane protein
MNTAFLSIIKRIITEQGEAILAEPQRLKGWISDYAKDEPKAERLAFGRCIEAGAYGELKNVPSGSRASVKRRLAQKLHNEQGLDMMLCADALDVLEAALWGSSATQPAATQPAAAPQYPQTPVAQTPYAAPASPQSSYYTQQPGQIQTNEMLRRTARGQLKGSWLPAAGMAFVWVCILSLLLFIPFIGQIGYFILTGPLTLGAYGYYLTKARGGKVTLSNLFDGFNMFGQGFLLNFFSSLFIVLWTLLLIIPGIIKSLSYSMAYYVMLDNPHMNALDAITASRKMMNGYKGKLLGLYISFIGWALLCILSLGIGFFWLIPYINLAEANFYEDLKKNGVY